MPVEVDYGSEFRYRSPVVDGKTLTIGISQSGETADTVAALNEARRSGSPIAAIVNVPGSQIARLADAVFATHAGPEIGVASTKAFTTQLAVLYLLAAKLRASRGLAPVLSEEERRALAHLPEGRRRCAGDRAGRSRSSPGATSTRRTFSSSAAASTTRWLSKGR